MDATGIDAVRRGFERARERRQPWEMLWRECYTYGQPQRGAGLGPEFAAGRRWAEQLFDGTAPDAVEQLAASLLAELTPPWSQWFGLRPGPGIPDDARGAVALELEAAAARLRGHLDRSNFAIEMHQCFLDLVTVGTATLSFREAAIGETTAFSFAAVPAAEMYVDGDQNGRIRAWYRGCRLPIASVQSRYPEAVLPDGADGQSSCDIVEAVLRDGHGYRYVTFMPGQESNVLLAEGKFEHSPFLTFRWVKGAGEIYGRSPVMTALPDIKTANKVVELILKNASIAVTGIWLADDDGVLNPSNIKLVPGSIIPKAVGSAGLTPLAAPGRFDVSELVLNDLRSRIRHTLLTDRLGQISGRMTATEVLERAGEMTRLLGAMFGRLQGELLTPLLTRAISILRRRGEIGPFALDGHMVELHARSPLARQQSRDDVQNVLMWLETVGKMGPAGAEVLDLGAAARWLATALGVPDELVREVPPLADLLASVTANG